jgi:hypothetical protein
MEYAVPKANRSAHSVSLNKPIVSRILLEENIIIQSASRKIAGVRINVDLRFGRYFFMAMGNL